MSYRIFLKRSAEKELDAIQRQVWGRVQRKILALSNNPRPVGVQKLQGQSAYRIRVGDYRILYVIDDTAKRVEIVAVGHRREVYR